MQHVLIQGAGIAGAVLAFWLQRLGFAITFVERSARPRSGGQAVDVRGTALEVIARMDLLDELNAQRTRFLGMLVYDEKGHEFERVANRTIGSRPEDGDIELFRDDLSRTLYAGVGSAPTFIFGDEIAGLHESSSGVQVTLASGRELQADFVVGADGVNSGLRRLVFGTDAALLRHLGFYGGFYSRPNIPRLEGWQLVVRTGERGVILYPSRNNAELRVCLYFATGELEPASGDPRVQRELFKNHCGESAGRSRPLSRRSTVPRMFMRAPWRRCKWIGGPRGASCWSAMRLIARRRLPDKAPAWLSSAPMFLHRSLRAGGGSKIA